jgi:hypothetical protein
MFRFKYAIQRLILIFANFINAIYEVLIQVFDFHFSCWNPGETTLNKILFQLTAAYTSGADLFSIFTVLA